MLSDIQSYSSIDSALTKLIRSIMINPKTELVPVFSSAGRVLKEDIKSNYNIPKYHSSHMDGFAIISQDTVNASKSNPVTLRIAKDIPILGKKPDYILKPGEAFRINTGGFLPRQSDAIVPIEDTRQECNDADDDCILIFSPIKRNNYVYKAGNDIKKGKKILSKGQILRAQDMALLANLKLNSIPVYKKPIVTIIPTGTELTDSIDDYKKNNFGKIINTNGPIISCIVDEMGAISNRFPVTKDNLVLLKKKLKTALKKSDIVITIGGSSVGSHDLVAESINSIGTPGIIAHGIKLDRGRVSGLGVVDKKPIIMLPGPIQGALNAFIAFARPLIRSFLGLPSKSDLSIIATITDKWVARKKFSNFKKIVYVKASLHHNDILATPYIDETQSFSLLNKCNGYIEVSEDITEIHPREKVLIDMLPGFSFMNDRLL